MTKPKIHNDNMRFNQHEEDNYGRADCQPKTTASPSGDVTPGKAPDASSGSASSPSPGAVSPVTPRKACRHHIDESLGGAHH